ncbi:ABC transporter substrate-binding protein [Acetobacter persici]|uniref:ABC transporter substrate-binding protein n=1 Tax=Acetobacter persici TaxID=1076596 RepID=UPI001F476ECC|nr:ABC transporter substrate-binding protein [Acetobacter persici]MCG0996568.1 ABC transporter substrate-binding protein [Acetobacter persici]
MRALSMLRHRGVRRSVSTTLLAGLTVAGGLAASSPQSASAQIAVDPTPETLAAHRGGTLRLVAAASGGTLDPQINYTAKYINLYAVVYDGLTTFRKTTGPRGNEVVPDLAETLPTPQDGGRTYVFTLRPDIRFSNGQPLTTADVVASFRRIFRVGSPTAGSFYSAITGADACLNHPADCSLKDGLSDDPARRTITFHLAQPDTEFLQKLAFTHAVILPASTPDHDIGNEPIPGTGPYRVTSYDPNKILRLDRNPYFHVWDAQAQPDGYPDGIDYSFGIPDEAAVTAVENGQYDWMADTVPMDRLGELGSRFTAQTHVTPHPAMYFIPMNVNLPPFNQIKARQAVNYALNRKAMVILYGGPGIARPLCGMLPSSLPVTSDQCFYTRGASPSAPAARWTAPDLEKARALVRESGTAGQHVTLVTANTSIDYAMGTWLRDMLQSIGYEATLRPLSSSMAFNYMQNSGNHVQIALKDWSADYPSPSNFLDDLLGCENFHPNSDSSINIPGFCDKHIQAIMDRAKTDVSLTPQQTDDLWRQADRLLMEQAPIAPVIEKDDVIITSPRLKNFFYTQVNKLFFSQVWLH